MASESFQGPFRHGVHCERSGKALDIKNVGGLRILGSSAGPQRTLRTSTEVVNAHPTRGAKKSTRCFVSALCHRDAQLVMGFIRRLIRNSRVPAADENRSYRTDVWIKTSIDTTFDASQERFGR